MERFEKKRDMKLSNAPYSTIGSIGFSLNCGSE